LLSLFEQELGLGLLLALLGLDFVQLLFLRFVELLRLLDLGLQLIDLCVSLGKSDALGALILLVFLINRRDHLLVLCGLRQMASLRHEEADF